VSGLDRHAKAWTPNAGGVLEISQMNSSGQTQTSLGPQALVLAGPTAVGKSELALELAERLGGEIISVDSMQVYRGMDIGTAKPSMAQRARVPHHLIDVVEVTQPFDAAQFVRLAGQAVTEIQARGKFPMLCGGTGLYFKALFEGLGHGPKADPGLRAQLTVTPLVQLLAELAERDPVTYQRIDRQNPRRVIRAVEVIRLTAKPFSAQRAPWGAPDGMHNATSEGQTANCCLGITRDSGDLHRRIQARVEEMFRRGLVAETKGLLERGLDHNPTAMQALGYRQVVEHLRGQRPLDETLELVKIRTRQFAKRQMTWFRRQARLHWLRLEPDGSIEQAAAKAVDILRLMRHNPT
jgi:tRNA dimethylallyltransferase